MKCGWSWPNSFYPSPLFLPSLLPSSPSTRSSLCFFSIPLSPLFPSVFPFSSFIFLFLPSHFSFSLPSSFPPLKPTPTPYSISLTPFLTFFLLPSCRCGCPISSLSNTIRSYGCQSLLLWVCCSMIRTMMCTPSGAEWSPPSLLTDWRAPPRKSLLLLLCLLLLLLTSYIRVVVVVEEEEVKSTAQTRTSCSVLFSHVLSTVHPTSFLFSSRGLA